MKYIVCYTANRKNAKRHCYTELGRRVYFNSVEEAKNCALFGNSHYKAEVLTANFEKVEETAE